MYSVTANRLRDGLTQDVSGGSLGAQYCTEYREQEEGNKLARRKVEGGWHPHERRVLKSHCEREQGAHGGAQKGARKDEDQSLIKVDPLQLRLSCAQRSQDTDLLGLVIEVSRH